MIQGLLEAASGPALWDIRSGNASIGEYGQSQKKTWNCAGDAGEENIGLKSAYQREMIKWTHCQEKRGGACLSLREKSIGQSSSLFPHKEIHSRPLQRNPS